MTKVTSNKGTVYTSLKDTRVKSDNIYPIKQRHRKRGQARKRKPCRRRVCYTSTTICLVRFCSSFRSSLGVVVGAKRDQQEANVIRRSSTRAEMCGKSPSSDQWPWDQPRLFPRVNVDQTQHRPVSEPESCRLSTPVEMYSKVKRTPSVDASKSTKEGLTRNAAKSTYNQTNKSTVRR